MAGKKAVAEEATTTVQFVEPPAQRGGRAQSERDIKIAEELRANPGQWALILENAKNDSLAVRIRTGRAKSFAEGKWEAITRAHKDGGRNIYARYIGEGEGEGEGE